MIAGAPADAVYIYDADAFNNIRNDLGGYYVLMTDIDLSTTSYSTWTTIGDYSRRLSGTLEGNGHVISNVSINSTSSYQGFFYNIYSTGTVKNLGFEGGSISGDYSVGFLASGNLGTIINCYATGNVYGSDNVGGLVGSSSGSITDCYATGIVNASSNCVQVDSWDIISAAAA